jgi:hypothetical protein
MDGMNQALIEREAEIGGMLFGTVPAGRSRKFYCLDEKTWIWREEWTSSDGKHNVVTVRYEVRPDGVLKYQEGAGYRPMSFNEAQNLYRAVGQYRQQVSENYERMLAAARSA